MQGEAAGCRCEFGLHGLQVDETLKFTKCHLVIVYIMG